MISAVAFARDLYSASVLDLDTVACFLALQEIKLGPKYIANPPVDLLSSTQPAQSASEKALTNVEDDFLKVNPRFAVPLTYLNILFTAVHQYSFYSCPVNSGRRMEKLAYLVDREGYIWSGESQVLKCSNYTPVPCTIFRS
jgi:hypothetical protein